MYPDDGIFRKHHYQPTGQVHEMLSHLKRILRVEVEERVEEGEGRIKRS